MSKFVAALAVVSLVVSLAPQIRGQSRAATRVAFVSGQRVLNESVPGKAEAARLQALQQRKATEVQALQQAIEATRQELTRATDDAGRVRLLQQEQTQRAAVERAAIQAQQEIQALQRQLQTGLQTRAKAIISELVKGRDIQLVLEGDTSVVWADPSADLTSEVLQRLNAAPAN
jgi:Skp family chaperone for outer membrane proteins